MKVIYERPIVNLIPNAVGLTLHFGKLSKNVRSLNIGTQNSSPTCFAVPRRLLPFPGTWAEEALEGGKGLESSVCVGSTCFSSFGRAVSLAPGFLCEGYSKNEECLQSWRGSILVASQKPQEALLGVGGK